MASMHARELTRRDFLERSGAVVGAAAWGGAALAQEGSPEVLPCLDWPIRTGPRTPVDPTPVELALELAETPVEGAPRMPVARGSAAAAPAVAQFAPRGASPARAAARMAALNRWQVQVLNVMFEPSASEGLVRKVLAIAQEWSEYTGLELRRSSAANAEIRIGFETRLTRPDSGHWSYVGVESSPQFVRGKSMNLAISERSLDTNPYDKAVVLHEFGHALGAIHEHQNPDTSGIKFDRAKTLAYFRTKFNWPEQQTIDNVLKRYSAKQLVRFSKFDGDSIMLYAYPASITVDSRGTKQNYVLSQTDKSFMRQLYGLMDPGEDLTEKSDRSEPSGPRAIALDGEILKAVLTPGDRVHNYTFELVTPRTCVIATDGSTQLKARLFKEEQDLELKFTTNDLVNVAAKLDMSAGKYRVRIEPKHSGGVGEYQIALKRP